MSGASDDATDRVPTLSRLGLGAWAFGGVGWGTQDDRDSIAAIRRAVELGVNWIDTAAVYGEGHAEQIVCDALGDLPETDQPLLFTKAGIRIDPRTGKTYRDLTPASLRAECDASLRRLGLSQIDLYQLHWPVEEVAVVELAWATLGELRQEGKIRWAGVSNFDSDLLERCSRICDVDAVQSPLSLLERKAASEILPWASAHGTRMLVYSPIESGLLSGRFTCERLANMPADDWRRLRPQFQSPRVERALHLVELLRPIAAKLDVTLAELAVAWTLHFGAVTGAIVGARNAAQVDGWIRAAKLELDTHTLEAIADASARSLSDPDTRMSGLSAENP